MYHSAASSMLFGSFGSVGLTILRFSLIVRGIFYRTASLIREARERIEKRGEAVGIRAARFGKRALARFVERYEPSFCAARYCTRDVEARRELRATKDEKGLRLRQFLLDTIDKRTKCLDARERDRLRGPSGLCEYCENVILHLVEKLFHAPPLCLKIFGACGLRPPREGIQLIELA